jgi:2-polyprenyl-6-hydroxyphenyl methylase/3-demethylubiquinone-9 3-methyltransferase
MILKMQGKSFKEDNFSHLANDWWDVNGKMSILHKMNPVRLKYINSIISKYHKNNAKIADIGCGGGLLSEGLSRFGYNIVGFDASDELIKVAKNHADSSGLNIVYETTDKYKDYSENFDVIVCLEVLEHVEDIDEFISSIVKMGKKDSIFIFSTINRTISSLFVTKIVAEYILRKVPMGMHSWNKFLKPSDVLSIMERYNMKAIDIKGMKVNPINMEFSMSDNISTNYFIAFRKC